MVIKSAHLPNLLRLHSWKWWSSCWANLIIHPIMHTCMHTLPLQTLKYFQLTASKEEVYLFLTNRRDFSRTMFTPLPFLVPKYSFTFLNTPTKKKSILDLKRELKTKLNSIITRTKYGLKEKRKKKKRSPCAVEAWVRNNREDQCLLSPLSASREKDALAHS